MRRASNEKRRRAPAMKRKAKTTRVGATRICGYPVHPAAQLFPVMPEEELRELAADISQRGQIYPVVLHEGKVLDGRNRLIACELAGRMPFTTEWDGKGGASVTAYVLACNVKRRHLNRSQLAMVAAEALPLFEAEAKERQLANLNRGKKKPASAAPGRGRRGKAAAAAAYSVGAAGRSVERAKAVQVQAPELAEAVKAGKVTLKQAERQIRKAAAVEAIKTYRPPEGKFALIVRDPAWPYADELSGSDAIRGGLPYPARTIEDICASVPPAADDCVLWLWVTNAHLLDGSALEVLRAWGFTPKTMATWPKPKMGVGRWLRGQTEHVILAVKGKPVVDLTSETTLLPSWPLGAHSEKPNEFFRVVAKLCPVAEGARLEMDATCERPGWVTSGAQGTSSVHSSVLTGSPEPPRPDARLPAAPVQLAERERPEPVKGPATRLDPPVWAR
ncbi:MAG: MT-A70 family methyltransferase [Candidatus Acidiferrales bacterium]